MTNVYPLMLGVIKQHYACQCLQLKFELGRTNQWVVWAASRYKSDGVGNPFQTKAVGMRFPSTQ